MLPAVFGRCDGVEHILQCAPDALETARDFPFLFLTHSCIADAYICHVHLPILLCIYVYLSLQASCLFVCLSVALSISSSLSIHVSVFLSISLLSLSLSVTLSIYLSLCLPLQLSLHLPRALFPSVCLSISLSAYLCSSEERMHCKSKVQGYCKESTLSPAASASLWTRRPVARRTARAAS